MAVIVTLTAYAAVASGNCTAVCLIAGSPAIACDCRCDGAFHGALADNVLATTHETDQPSKCGAIPPGFGLESACGLPAGHPPIPPLPARYEHHNGGDYGPTFWDELVDPSEDCTKCHFQGSAHGGPCGFPSACPIGNPP